jgi:DNA-binding transcriptional MerR regulator
MYNLRAVVQETGLKADTLRAWERRYGLPVPNRSKGGHRLYSRRDIEILKWLVNRVDEGLSISRAVELWRKLESEGEDPIADSLPLHLGQVRTYVDSGSNLEELQGAWMGACLQFDERAAEIAINQAFALFPLETVTHLILQKTLAEVGEKWFSGEVSVQQEHFISQLTIRRLNTLIAAAPAPDRLERVIVACPPSEQHTIPLLMITLGLRRAGFQVYYFGANTPVDQLDGAVDKIQPNLVLSTAQQLSSASGLYSMALALQEQTIPFAYGGRIFNIAPNLLPRIPGHFLGMELPETFAQIEQIVGTSIIADDGVPVENQYSQAYERLRNNIQRITNGILSRIPSNGAAENGSMSFLDHLNRSLLSALKIGNLDLLDYELEWLDNLIENRPESSLRLKHILEEYISGAQENLGSDAQLITEWFQERISHTKQGSTS